jgi:hypothetical protein
MAWQDTVKMLVTGMPPGEKQLSRYGTIPVPGEGAMQLPAKNVTFNYAESVKSGTVGEDIQFGAPGDLTVTVTDGAGQATTIEPPRYGESIGTRKNFSHVKVGKFKAPAEGTYTVKVTGTPEAGSASPRVILG